MGADAIRRPMMTDSLYERIPLEVSHQLVIN